MPNGTRGNALVASVPIVDDGVAMGSVILFEDNTRLRSVTSELNQLKKNNGRPQAN